MKKLFTLSMMLFTLISVVNANDFKHIQLTDFRTNSFVDLSTIDQTKPTYIKLWATWCKPCMAQMPHFQSLQEKYGNKINILAVNININEDKQYIDKVITQFALTMPVLLDNEGQLAVALGLVGTPYSVLINTDGSIVYTTHESDKLLDTFIEKLAQGQKLSSESSHVLSEQQKASIIQPWLTGNHVLFFSATWCDWYLKDSRPEMAKSCENIQLKINELRVQSTNKEWHGFANHLWTDNKALADFKDLYKIDFPFDIDIGGVLFNHFNIRQIPTMIIIENGNVSQKITGEAITNITAK